MGQTFWDMCFNSRGKQGGMGGGRERERGKRCETQGELMTGKLFLGADLT